MFVSVDYGPAIFLIFLSAVLIISGIIGLYYGNRKKLGHNPQAAIEHPSSPCGASAVVSPVPSVQIQNPQNVTITSPEKKITMEVINGKHTCSICGKKLIVGEAMGAYSLYCSENIMHGNGPWCDSPEEAKKAFRSMVHHNVRQIEA